jgi:hypothetical protein
MIQFEKWHFHPFQDCCASIGSIRTFFSGIGSLSCGKQQEDVTEKKKSGKNHHQEIISGYGIILDSTKLTIIVWPVTALGVGISDMVVALIDFGYRICAYIIVAFGLYIVFCTGRGIEFPWLHLPLSNWRR